MRFCIRIGKGEAFSNYEIFSDWGCRIECFSPTDGNCFSVGDNTNRELNLFRLGLQERMLRTYRWKLFLRW